MSFFVYTLIATAVVVTIPLLMLSMMWDLQLLHTFNREYLSIWLYGHKPPEYDTYLVFLKEGGMGKKYSQAVYGKEVSSDGI